MALAAPPPGVVILTSSEQLKVYDQLVRATLTGAEDQLVRLFRVLNFEDIPLSREEMKRFLAQLVDAYGPALTQGALDWYQELRPAYKTAYTPKALIPADSAEPGYPRRGGRDWPRDSDGRAPVDLAGGGPGPERPALRPRPGRQNVRLLHAPGLQGVGVPLEGPRGRCGARVPRLM